MAERGEARGGDRCRGEGAAGAAGLGAHVASQEGQPAGEHVGTQLGGRLRTLRQARGLSVRTLAARTDFSPSFISQVENGLASPSIASLARIAEQLGTSLGQFFGAADAAIGSAGGANALGPRVVRASTRQALVSSWSRARVETLGLPGAGHRLEPVLITFAPGGRSGAAPYPDPRELFAIVFEGELRLTLVDEPHTLGRGDAVAIPAGTPHRWENAGPGPASVVVVGLLAAPPAGATGGPPASPAGVVR